MLHHSDCQTYRCQTTIFHPQCNFKIFFAEEKSLTETISRNKIFRTHCETTSSEKAATNFTMTGTFGTISAGQVVMAQPQPGRTATTIPNSITTEYGQHGQASETCRLELQPLHYLVQCIALNEGVIVKKHHFVAADRRCNAQASIASGRKP